MAQLYHAVLIPCYLALYIQEEINDIKIGAILGLLYKFLFIIKYFTIIKVKSSIDIL